MISVNHQVNPPKSELLYRRLPLGRRVFRLLKILFVLRRYGLDAYLKDTRLNLFFRGMLLLIGIIVPRKRIDANRAERLRLAIEALGPIFVKMGQIISTRLDILPQDFALELIKLQDRVPSFSSDQSIAIVEAAYGAPISEIFADFESMPLASASIAQVHAATLKDGENVVVKVLRPDIDRAIAQDLWLLSTIAGLVHWLFPQFRRFKPRELVSELANTLEKEIDLTREAANASKLKKNFEKSDLLYVPEIEWRFSRKNVMVMERVYGVQISDVEELKRRGCNMKALAENGVTIFFRQVFDDCFFHADMHPGNVFVDVSNPENPQYMAIDFGIMGSLDANDQYYLAANFVAFFRRDYRRVAELHISSGWVPSDTSVVEFEAAIRTVCEPIFDRPLSQISFGHTLVRLLDVARSFNMPIQPQLALLQKTLINIEGLGRQLYPELDLWKTAKPFLERWMRKTFGVRRLLREIQNQSPFLMQHLPELPSLLHQRLSETKEARRKWRGITPRYLMAMTCILAGAILIHAAAIANPHLADERAVNVMALTLLVLAVVSLFQAWRDER